MKNTRVGVGLVVCLLVLVGAKPEDDYEWPEALSVCPAHIKLDRSKMEDLDGRKEKTFRRRPWPDGKKMEHSELEVSDMRLHHFLNQSAIHINSGSPDKPKTSNGQVGSYTKIVLRNLDIGPIQRSQAGLHMDHIWIGPGHDEAFRPDVLFEDIFLHGGNGGVMPVLFEQGGKWGTLTIRRVAVMDCRHPFMVKLKNASFKEIVIEECPGLRIVMQGAGEPVTIRVRRSEGITLQFPKDNEGDEANVTVVRE